MKRNVLDHGYVTLVNNMGDDLSVVRAARVSYDSAEQTGKNPERDNKLIHFLMRQRHTTPFESVVFQFEVRAPIFVFRQWMRHRTWSYNEISARYRPLPEQYYVPDPTLIGVQSTDNKQCRDVDGTGDPIDRSAEVEDYVHSCASAFHDYHKLLDSGWPRELARCVLPLSTYSALVATVDLHNLLHFLRLRQDAHAQYEIRQYAAAIIELIEPIVPVCIAAWRETL